MSLFDRRPNRPSGEYLRVCPDCDSVGPLTDRFCGGCGRSFRATGLPMDTSPDEASDDD